MVKRVDEQACRWVIDHLSKSHEALLLLRLRWPNKVATISPLSGDSTCLQ